MPLSVWLFKFCHTAPGIGHPSARKQKDGRSRAEWSGREKSGPGRPAAKLWKKSRNSHGPVMKIPCRAGRKCRCNERTRTRPLLPIRSIFESRRSRFRPKKHPPGKTTQIRGPPCTFRQTFPVLTHKVPENQTLPVESFFARITHFVTHSGFSPPCRMPGKVGKTHGFK